MLTVPKPWGHEEIWVIAPGKYAGKYLHVNAGHRLSLQYHQFKDESMLLVSGEGYLEMGQTLATMERVDLSRDEAVRIEPGVLHRLVAVTDLVVLEVSTDELDDVFRVEDDYDR